MTGKRIAVVILNWNGKHFLEQFLGSVKSCSPPQAEIVVADNASADDSVDYLRTAHPDVKVLAFGENLGFAGGYNAALQVLDHEYFVLLNSDIEVSPGWIEPVIAVMEADKRIAACQPKILSWHDKGSFEYAGASGGFLDQYGYPFCRGRLFDSLEKDKGQYDTTREVFWATGACMFVRGEAYKALGGFDDRFFAHMEEIDLCWRMQHQGYKVVACPDSRIYHIGGGTLPKSSPAKTYLNFRNSLWMLAKNLPARRFYPTMIIRLALDKLAAAKFLLSGHPRDGLAVCRAYMAFFRHFRAMRKASRNLPDRLPENLFRKSIVRLYYMGGKKTFSQLDFGS